MPLFLPQKWNCYAAEYLGMQLHHLARTPACVERIIQSEDSDDKLPLALRLSGLLLLGLVKIYSRQLKYLQEDCLTAVQELDKADKVAGLPKGQNKHYKKNSKTTTANQADVTVPDEPHQLFRFSSLSEEEGFGLFEENHAGLAMAAEAHASFMDLEFSLSQSDAHDDSAMVHLDEPEQLRAVPVEFDNEVEPALPFGDDLPRMTPTKRLGRSASRDMSPEAINVDQPTVGQEAQPDTADDMLPEALPIDDLPDLPPIARPSDASDTALHSPAEMPPESPGAPTNREDAGCVIVQAQAELELVPDPAPDPVPDTPAASVPDLASGPEERPLDVSMVDLQEIPADDVGMNEMPLENDAGTGPGTTEPGIEVAIPSDQPEPVNSSRTLKRKQGKRNKPEAQLDPAPKQHRKRSAPKLRKDADKQATTVAADEMRELLKNRSSLICKLPPIVSKTRRRVRHLHTDDLDILLVPSAIQEPSLDRRMIRLFDAMGSCAPLSLQSLRGDDAANLGGHDEIEDAQAVPDPQSANVVSTDMAMQVEVLRDERPSVSGSRAVPSVSNQANWLEANEREVVQGDDGIIMQTDGALDVDLPAMELPSVDASDIPTADLPAPATPAPDLHPIDLPSPDMPLPDLPEPDMPNTGSPSHVQHDPAPAGMALPGPSEPHPPAGSLIVPSPATDADALHEHTPVETLYSAPGTQGTVGADDSSLNQHTVHTFQQIEMLSQGPPDSRKRKKPQTISMSQLVLTTDRPEAAKLFYDVLVLQAKGMIQMHEQRKPYSELQMMLNAGQV